MKILVIAPEQLPVPAIVGGSVETCIDQVFRRLAARGHRITIISRAHPRLPQTGRSSGGKIHHIRISAKSKARYISQAMRATHSQAYDFIQVENRPTFIQPVRKRFPRTPMILSLHSLTFMSRLSRHRGNQVLRLVNGVTTVGHFVTSTMKRRFPAYKHKFFTSHQGVNTTLFRPRSLAERARLRRQWSVSGTTNILFVGRTVPTKGLHTLVKATGRIPKTRKPLRLIVAGSSWPGKQYQSPYIRTIKHLAKELHIRLTFTGYIPPARIHHIYQLADIFVCPTKYREGFGLVNVEAMASGIPVIASRRGGIPEIIQHEHNGLLVADYNNPAAFASAIHRILSNHSFAKRLAINGRRCVKQKFSWGSTAKRLENRYRIIRRNK
ncbi:MAG: glycosyltransferase family 4 protein [Paenibacillaceae bacterium]